MLAIGLRMQIESEIETREANQQRIGFNITQRQAELDRHVIINTDWWCILTLWKRWLRIKKYLSKV
jgi:hypothetical protein